MCYLSFLILSYSRISQHMSTHFYFLVFVWFLCIISLSFHFFFSNCLFDFISFLYAWIYFIFFICTFLFVLLIFMNFSLCKSFGIWSNGLHRNASIIAYTITVSTSQINMLSRLTKYRGPCCEDNDLVLSGIFNVVVDG